jgi:hypothetical protein
VKIIIKLYLVLCVVTLVGCETVKQGGRKSGEIIGEGANIVGSVTEGGADAIQGKTNEDNPYGR